MGFGSRALCLLSCYLRLLRCVQAPAARCDIVVWVDLCAGFEQMRKGFYESSLLWRSLVGQYTVLIVNTPTCCAVYIYYLPLSPL